MSRTSPFSHRTNESKTAICVEEDVQIPLQCAIPSEQELLCSDSVVQSISEPTLVNTQELEYNSEEPQITGSSDRRTGSFIGSNVFNLSKRNLTGAEIPVLSKGLDFCPVPIDFDKE